jgi:virginiamycin B lyase
VADLVAVGRLALVLAVAGCTAQPPDPTPSSVPTTRSEGPTAAPSAGSAAPSAAPEPSFEVATYPVTAGSRPHDVAPAPDGTVWYTAQATGRLGRLDPETGEVEELPLGDGSQPHGVIVGPDEAAWVTDGGLNAIVHVDGSDQPSINALDVANVGLNTAAFDGDGILWFTGQAGFIGRHDPETGESVVYEAPRGQGPYGIASTPDGEVWFASLAGSYLGRIDRATGEVAEIDTPTGGGGARRVWSDSSGSLWVTEWFAGKLARYDPDTEEWAEWQLPGSNPMPYAVYVDERDAVWVTDFGANAILRFDPASEEWRTFELESQPGEVRQLLGRDGEVWGAESAADQLVVIRTTD